MANPGEFTNNSVWQLYNTCPTAGSATTAQIELTDLAGVDFYNIASLTIPIAATNLYKAVSDWLAANDASNQASVLARAAGGTIRCVAETRFNCSGAAANGTVNTPLPTTTSNKFWAAGTAYDFGIKRTA
jgi:hypothetical protein